MQRLIVNLASAIDAPVSWLVFSDQENEIIASGTLGNLSELPSLKDRASSAEIIALAPASELYFTELELPKNANRKALSAIPFMVEEELCGDIENLFFALGKKQDNKQEVAVINRQVLSLWQKAFADAELLCTRILPDAHCLPVSQDINLLEINNNLLVRMPDGRAMQGECSWMLPLVIELAKENEYKIHGYTDINSLPEDIEATYNFDLLPLQLLMQGIDNCSVNLCQGEFLVKRKTNSTWDKWKVAASLAIIALCVNLVMKTSELNQLKAERFELRQQIQADTKQGFPSLQRVTNHRRVIAREIAKLEQGGGNLSMLAMLSRLGNAFQASDVKPQTIKYDSRRSEIRIQSVARSFEALETFTRDARGLGFEVDQGAINNKGDEVVGLIMIRG